MSMRRIAIAGPEATGKSSLARLLSQQLQLPLIEDPRSAFLESARCDTLFEAGRYRPVWLELLDLQLEREATNDEPAVLDTCAIDYWTHWQRWGWCGATVRLSERMYKRTAEAANRYLCIVIMPPRQLAPPRGSRFLNAEYAQQISRLTRAFVREAGCTDRCIELADVNPHDYATAVLAGISPAGLTEPSS